MKRVYFCCPLGNLGTPNITIKSLFYQNVYYDGVMTEVTRTDTLMLYVSDEIRLESGTCDEMSMTFTPHNTRFFLGIVGDDHEYDGEEPCNRCICKEVFPDHVMDYNAIYVDSMTNNDCVVDIHYNIPNDV